MMRDNGVVISRPDLEILTQRSRGRSSAFSQRTVLPSLTSLRALVDFDHRVYLRHVPEDVLEVEERAFR